MLEKTVEGKTVKLAESLGWWSCKFTSPSLRGVMDRMFIKGGRVIFVEFKRPNEKPRKLQEVVIRNMRKYGAEIYTIDTIEGGEELFEVTLC